jgi:hypothetical protein
MQHSTKFFTKVKRAIGTVNSRRHSTENVIRVIKRKHRWQDSVRSFRNVKEACRSGTYNDADSGVF